MKPILLDTGFIVALLDRSEKHHKMCVDIVNNINRHFITCEAVITESCYLLRNFPKAQKAIIQNIANHIFDLQWNIVGNELRIIELMEKYKSVPMDFADACLVVMAENYNIKDILTLDSDFEIYKFNNNGRFFSFATHHF